MTLNLCSPSLPRLSPQLSNSKLYPTTSATTKATASLFLFLLNAASPTCFSTSTIRPLALGFSAPKKRLRTATASLSDGDNGVGVAEAAASLLLDDGLLNRISAAKDASEALDMIAEHSKRPSGVVSSSDCCSIISAAVDPGNIDLALSVFSAMRSTFDPGAADGETTSFVQRWKWSRPDVHTYTLLIQGLAASLRVSDALEMIGAVSRVGVSPGEEVPFGKIVKCPTCLIAVTVAQPQHGIQIVSCSKCRYQYELVSGNIISIESEEIRIPYCRTQHGGACLEKGAKIPANKEAKHSCCSSLYCGIILPSSRNFEHPFDVPIIFINYQKNLHLLRFSSFMSHRVIAAPGAAL